MHRRPPIRVLLILLLLLLGFAAWYLTRANGTLPYLGGSGTIYADEYIVASQTAGQVIELTADEGDTVHAGQVLAKLDAALGRAQLEQADAALLMAQANLAKLQAGVRAEEIKQAQAALAQAEARRATAKTTLADAQTLRDNPQDLQLRTDAARAALAVAEHRARAANLVAQSASLERAFHQQTLSDIESGTTIEIVTPAGVFTKTLNIRTEELSTLLGLAASKEWNAWATQAAAFAQRDGARADLDNLLIQQKDPLALNAQVDAARTQVDTAEAAIQVARAKLDALQAGTRSENIAAAQAQVAQAQAARDAVQAQLGKMSLTAPADGIVNERFLHLGEMAAPGSAVFHIANFDLVTLTVYVPENQIGKAHVGAPASVKVDSFPQRTFPGKVTFISPQAEFTPKNIATSDQRSTLVFAVKIAIENLDHALKAGMPADAVIAE